MFTITKRVRKLTEVLGQETVIKALQNLINKEAIPQVILFLGYPGSGKTTLGEIISMSLLCKDLKTIDGNKVPCLECSACRIVQSQKSQGDFYHFDGVTAEDVDLIEQVLQYSPIGKNQVFLLNELHDSTAQASKKFKGILEKNQPNVYFVITSSDSEKFRDFLPTNDNKTKEKIALSGRMVTFNIKPLSTQIINNALTEQLIEADPESEIPDSIYDVMPLIAQNSKSSIRSAYNMFETIINSKIYTKDEAKELLGFDNDEKENYFLLSLLAKKNVEFMKQMSIKKFESIFYYLSTVISNIAEAEITGYDDKEEWQIKNAKEVINSGNFESIVDLFLDIQSKFSSTFNEGYFKMKLYKYFKSKTKLNEKVTLETENKGLQEVELPTTLDRPKIKKIPKKV